MFRDIWKRFGAKMLIVLCSVLLLGGVAIAAPRLRAVGEKVDLSTVQVVPDANAAAQITTGAAIWIKEPEKLIYSTSGKVFPSTLMLQKKGEAAVELSGAELNGKDYNVAVEAGSDWQKAGDVKITLTATRGSQYLVSQSKLLNFKYTIQKQEITDIAFKVKNDSPSGKDYTVYDTQNILLVESAGSPVSTSNIEVTVNGTELKEGAGYSLTQSDGVTPYVIPNLGVSGGLYVQFENYKHPNGTLGCAEFSNIRICGDLGKQRVVVDPEPTNSSQTVTANNITIFDKDNKEIPKSEYNLPKYEQNTGYLKIEGAGKLYGGYYERTFNFGPVSDEAVMLECVDNDFLKPQDFIDDLNRNIQVYPQRFQTPTGDATINASECSDFEWQFVEQEGYDEEGVPGATAGLVQIKFVIGGNNAYKGRKAHAYFPVIRNIESAEYKNDPKEGITYKYGSHKAGLYERVTKVWFADAGEDNPISTSLYDVTYKQHKWKDANLVVEGINNIEAAGRVYLTIKGKYENKADAVANAYNGGYYGEIVGTEETPRLYYDIEPQPLTDQHFMQLGTSIFAPTTDEPDVETNTMLGKKDSDGNVEWKKYLTTIGDRYGVEFFETKNGETPITVWNGKTGTFWAKFTFSGNYDGSVWAEFSIQEFDLRYMHVVLGDDCPQCLETNKTHKYMGKEHQPVVQEVYYEPVGGKRMTIPATEYDKEGAIQYLNAVNATSSNSKATVQITLNNGMVITQDFEIQPRGLDEGDLILDKDTDDFKTGAPRTHEYMGQNKLPGITKLVLKTQSLEIPMEIGTDFTYDAGYLGVYDKNGKKISSVRDANTATEYVYRIAKQGSNFKNPDTTATSYKATETFKITTRSISEDEVKFTLPAKPYVKGDTASEYLTYIQEKLEIRDDKFPGEDPLELDWHYEIKESDIDLTNLGVNSTISYTVHGKESGFYKSSKTLKLLVGKDITKSKVLEPAEHSIIPGEPVNGIPSGTVTLDGPYATAADGPGGVKFKGASAEAGVCLIYNLETSAGVEYLYMGASNQYLVTYDPSTPRPDDPMDKDSPLYGYITLQGINGYYGSIRVKVPI